MNQLLNFYKNWENYGQKFLKINFFNLFIQNFLVLVHEIGVAESVALH